MKVLVVAVLMPLLLDAVIFGGYLFTYSGSCGEHPPDIPARACDFYEYAGDFLGDAFAIVGLMAIDVAALAFSVLVAAVAIVVRVIFRETIAGKKAAIGS